MRQAGMKPKNHSSGTYWVRANANRAINKGSDAPTQEDTKSFLVHLLEFSAAAVFILCLVVGMTQ